MNQVIVKALMLDPVSNIPVVILKDTENSRLLPIWLGNFEANAIAMHLENLSAPSGISSCWPACWLQQPSASC